MRIDKLKIDKYFHLYSRKNDVVFEEVEKPEQRTGQWIIDDHDEYAVCDRCGEPCATYTLGKPRDRFCKWCGANMEADKTDGAY